MNEVKKVSHSQVMTWLRCKKKWQYGYIGQWMPQIPPKHFAMGDYMHDKLNVYYQLLAQSEFGTSYEELAGMLEELILEDLKEDASNGEEVLRAMKTLRRYILEVSPRIDDGIHDIHPEFHFEVPLTTPKSREFLLEGYVDLFYMKKDQYKIRDHKTTGAANGFWKKGQIESDVQQPTYIGGLRKLGYPIFGGEISELCTFNYKNYLIEPIDKLFRCSPMFQSEAWIGACLRWYGRVVDEMIDETDFIESLGRDCSYCYYYGPCTLQFQGKDDGKLLQIGFKRKDGWSEFHASDQAS